MQGTLADIARISSFYETARFNRQGQLLLDVKVHHYDLTPEIQKILNDLPAKHRERLQLTAENHARDDWWDWAGTLADELNVGGIFSAGRSGGWIEFVDVYRRHFEELLDPDFLHDACCQHCALPRRAHIKEERCFTSNNTFQLTSDDFGYDWARLFKFMADVEESLDSAGDRVSESIERILQQIKEDESLGADTSYFDIAYHPADGRWVARLQP